MADPTATDRITLPGADVAVPPLGVGTWAWGDRSTWGMGGYDADLTEASIRDAFEASLAAGVVLFDTAEVYGAGESERIIGRLLQADPSARERVVIATKFMPLPQKLNVQRALLRAARASCDRMGIESIDLYQLHGPISFRSHDALAEALVAAQSAGLVKAVGVSNYSAKEVRRIDEALRKRGARLATNQIEYSLLRTAPERGGLLAACRELGVVPLAYSPMGQGRLTGKYSAEHPPAGKRSFSAHPWERIDAVVGELRRVAEAHDRTPGQAALAWCIAKGTIPIPGAKNRGQAEQNAGALGWSLTAEELAALDGVALERVRSLQSRFWQHG
jgi:aryl-alcohol dehydrogenase-like predicted oxidoreductase